MLFESAKSIMLETVESLTLAFDVVLTVALGGRD
jgi:hypothetical protein